MAKGDKLFKRLSNRNPPKPPDFIRTRVQNVIATPKIKKYYMGEKVEVWCRNKNHWYMGTIFQMKDQGTENEKYRVVFGCGFPKRKWFFPKSRHIKPLPQDEEVNQLARERMEKDYEEDEKPIKPYKDMH